MTERDASSGGRTMNVTVRVPPVGDRELAPLLDELDAAPRGVPYGDDVLAVCGALATRLVTDPMARRHPELMALGFFMRPAELARMRREFDAATRPDVVRVPHGLVFHVPPSNVDTLFVYSWFLSVLAGNANIVRLSSRGSPVVDYLCGVLGEVLAGAAIGPVAMIQYDHDPAITAAISARAALRVIWGGDTTVDAIRRAPLSPFARDLTFADRWSMAALDASAVAALDAPGLRRLAEAMFDDLYWFDQLGCSSPRLALWIGTDAERTAARDRLWPAIASVVAERGYQLDAGTRLARETFIHRAILDGPVVARADFGPALAVLSIDRLAGLGRHHPGGGLVFEADAPSLAALDAWVARKDQTLTHFGLPRDSLVSLATRLGGRGLDRIVPVGQALAFARFWDGYDLAAELVRYVHVVL
jgi:hypothetical protein